MYMKHLGWKKQQTWKKNRKQLKHFKKEDKALKKLSFLWCTLNKIQTTGTSFETCPRDLVHIRLINNVKLLL